MIQNPLKKEDINGGLTESFRGKGRSGKGALYNCYSAAKCYRKTSFRSCLGYNTARYSDKNEKNAGI